MASTAALVALYTEAFLIGMTDDGADVDDRAAGGTHLLDRFLRRKKQAEHVEVELLVEVLRGDGLERRELVNAGVVHQHVELSVGGLGLGEETFDVVRFGDVGLHGDRFAALLVMRLTTASAPALLLA